MEKIKLLALDMDGTTLNSEHVISESTCRSLQKAIDSGIMIVPASGRSLPSLPKQLMDFDIHYAITKNGSVINDLTQGGKEIYHDTIDRELAIEILRQLEQHNCFVRFDAGEASYACKNHFQDAINYHSGYKKFENNLYDSLADLLQQQDLGVDKISATCFDQLTFEQVIGLQAEIIQLNIMSSGFPFVEINSRMTSKGYALKQLANMLGLSSKNVSAIGDNDNDLIMLCYAGYSFAMGNGSRNARETANEITLSNDENGVGYAIEKILERNRNI